jgi:hypothetical protein
MRIWNMNVLVIILAAAGCVSLDVAQSVRTGAMRSDQIYIDAATGPRSAIIAEQEADLQLSNGRTEAGYIVGVHDATSGLFWWRFEVANPTAAGGAIADVKERSRFFLTNSKIVSFFVAGGLLNVRESTERVSRLQDGMSNAVASLNASIREIEAGTKRWFTRVDLSRLGNEFFLRSGSAAPRPIRILSVSFSGAKWEVTLEGPDHDFARLTLDDNYQLLSVTREPPAR